MEIKVPDVGESVHEALLAKWFKHNGDAVRKDDLLCELETDKITLDLNADQDGILTVQVAEGQTIKIGTVIGTISDRSGEVQPPQPAAAAANSYPVHLEQEIRAAVSTPAARREMREGGIAPDSVTGTGKGGRITLDDLFARIQSTTRPTAQAEPPADTEESPPPAEPVATAPTTSPVPVVPTSEPVVEPQPAPVAAGGQPLPSVRTETAPVYAAVTTGRRDERKPMTPIRRRIAERLLMARQQTAMLTTFNEADLSQVKQLREKYRESFRQRHGISLGFMPFFVKACVEALREFPAVNASIDASDIVYHHYFDIGIAISGEKGLVVPVLRNADQMKMYEIDQAIAAFSEKISSNRLAISDLEGGTFSISNGGVFGSMLSTPILNPPQSGVLGMHAIQDRPVVRDGQIVIRPMMYLALSYDHRIIDGREAVGFLRRVKEYIENPEELLLEG